MMKVICSCSGANVWLHRENILGVSSPSKGTGITQWSEIKHGQKFLKD